MKTLAAALLLIGSLAWKSPGADTFVVAPDGSGDFPSIQTAIDAAVDDDVIELTDGTFLGDGNRDVDFLGKAVTVRSQSGDASACVVNCEGTVDEPHRAFLFVSGEGAGSVLEALTVAGGYVPGSIPPQGLGGGVHCSENSSPTIRGCVFKGNYAGFGGGVGCQTGAEPLLEACEFMDNSADRGGAVYCQSSSPRLVDCRLAGCTASRGGAVYCQLTSVPEITGCAFEGNSSDGDGGGVYCSSDASPSIEGCTFLTNTAGGKGGGIYLSASAPVVGTCTFHDNGASTGAGGIACNISSSPTVERTIIAFSSGGEALGLEGGSTVTLLSCCDFYGNAGGDWVGPIESLLGVDGNISADPLFCGPGIGDLTIDYASPCAPFSAPNESCDLIGAMPAACGTPPAAVTVTWGRIKAGFN